MEEKINKIINNFSFEGNLESIEENHQGNINTTYILKFNDKGIYKRYLLQKINSNVFKEPYLVMKNIELVSEHINKKLKQMNNTKYKPLNFIKTNSGELLYTYINEDGEKEYYRISEYIENCISYNNFKESSNSCEVAYNAGKCFGFFHKILSDFPTISLVETIPDFHNTPKRFNDLLLSIENNVKNRSLEVSNEIIDLISKIKECSIIQENLGKTIPIRVTHNDTKLNNILMDAHTNEGVTVIDLDTIMPGSVLYDIGDGIRAACANVFEDETDLTKVYLDLGLTKAYIKGYLSQMLDELTEEEINYIGVSIKILTYELVLRFLTDYLNGDTYFKIKYETHNKDRFLNQYTLLKDIENKIDNINGFVNEIQNQRYK